MERVRADQKAAKMIVMTSAKWIYPLQTGFGGHQSLSVHPAINVFFFFFFFLNSRRL